MAISKFNYNSFNVAPTASTALSFNSDADGFTTQSASSMIFIKSLTASNSANLSFVNGSSDVVLDDTYPVYRFVFASIHPETANEFSINFRDGDTNFDAIKTTSTFRSQLNKPGTATVQADASEDIAQGTGDQGLMIGSQIGTDNDECASGSLTLYNPASTTFIKHFVSTFHHISNDANIISCTTYMAGYCNVTAAIDGVIFKMKSGNFNGQIKMYGIKDS